MDPNSAGDLRKTYKITVIIGVAIMATALFYAAIVEFLKNQPQERERAARRDGQAGNERLRDKG